MERQQFVHLCSVVSFAILAHFYRIQNTHLNEQKKKSFFGCVRLLSSTLLSIYNFTIYILSCNSLKKLVIQLFL